MSQIHPQARATPCTRAEIRESATPLTELTERYNVTVATVRKRKSRKTPQDLSHRPHLLCTTLTPAGGRSWSNCAGCCCCRWMTC